MINLEKKVLKVVYQLIKITGVKLILFVVIRIKYFMNFLVEIIHLQVFLHYFRVKFNNNNNNNLN